MVQVTRFISSSENFKLLSKREERCDNIGKTVAIFLQIFREKLETFFRNNKNLKLVGHKVLIYIIDGILDTFLYLSRDF